MFIPIYRRHSFLLYFLARRFPPILPSSLGLCQRLAMWRKQWSMAFVFPIAWLRWPSSRLHRVSPAAESLDQHPPSEPVDSESLTFQRGGPSFCLDCPHRWLWRAPRRASPCGSFLQKLWPATSSPLVCLYFLSLISLSLELSSSGDSHRDSAPGGASSRSSPTRFCFSRAASPVGTASAQGQNVDVPCRKRNADLRSKKIRQMENKVTWAGRELHPEHSALMGSSIRKTVFFTLLFVLSSTYIQCSEETRLKINWTCGHFNKPHQIAKYSLGATVLTL